VIGAEFTAVLRAAQHGDESAFVRLWRDANPVMVRYLRIVSTGDPYDIACESWITAIRGLTGFRGDEVAWRSWLFASARLRAEDEGMQRVWHAFEHLDDLPEDDLDEPLAGDELDSRGLDTTLRSIGSLPLGQGEILMLRLAGGLPPATVAHIVGSDVSTVRVCERRALERLGTDADLLAWSLAADPLPAELADEGAVLATLHAIVPAVRNQSAKTLRVPISRMAGLGTAAATAGVLGLGGMSAAAHYTPWLPPHVQNVMAKVVGAPDATEVAAEVRGADGQGGTKGKASPPASAVGPGTTSSALTQATSMSTGASDYCRAWEADKKKGVPRESSTAYGALAVVAGGGTSVSFYCDTVLSATSSTSAAPQGTKPTQSTTQASPSSTATTPPTTGTPSTTTPETTTPTTTPETATPDTTTPDTTTTPPGTTTPPTPPTASDSGQRPSKTKNKTNTHTSSSSSSTAGTSGASSSTTSSTEPDTTNTQTTTTETGTATQGTEKAGRAATGGARGSSATREGGRSAATTSGN
jgi:DNA-directed RNA polymerase specialized sigma24 family protein